MLFALLLLNFAPMILWLIGIVLIGGLGAAGKWVGAIRSLVTMIGVWLGVFLGYSQAPKLWEIIAKQQYANPLTIWVGPIAAIFGVTLLVFGIIGVVAHMQVMVFFAKNRPDDKRVAFERMNSFTGIAAGAFTGASLFLVYCLATLQLGYWAVQFQNDGENSPLVKVFAPSYKWLEGSGLLKVARGLDPLPEEYYQIADVAGLLYNNPSAGRRLGQHPETMVLAETANYQSIANSSSFKSTFGGKPHIDDILTHDASYGAFSALDMPTTLTSEMYDWEDIYAYLKDGVSPKYSDDQIKGRWEVSILETVVAASKKVDPTDENAVVKLKFLQKAMGLLILDLQLLANADERIQIKGSIEGGAKDLKGLITGRPSPQLVRKVMKQIISGAKAAPKPKAPSPEEFSEDPMGDPSMEMGGAEPAPASVGGGGGSMLEDGALLGSGPRYTANWSDGMQGIVNVNGDKVTVEYGGGLIVFERIQ